MRVELVADFFYCPLGLKRGWVDPLLSLSFKERCAARANTAWNLAYIWRLSTSTHNRDTQRAHSKEGVHTQTYRISCMHIPRRRDAFAVRCVAQLRSLAALLQARRPPLDTLLHHASCSIHPSAVPANIWPSPSAAWLQATQLKGDSW